jgi:hypothetical protein
MGKQVSIDNFIGVYDNYFSDEFCDNLITHFEWSQRTNKTYLRPEAESVKNDESVCLNPGNIQEINFTWPNIQGYMDEFNHVFWNECYTDYLGRFSVLANYDGHTVYTYKVQKTLPGGGYHIWHSEDGSKQMAQRVGVYILYLNDVQEGGETEFLYQTKRVTAKKGRLVIFPPNYPWAHRGNPPLSGEKYILTGWMEFK